MYTATFWVVYKVIRFEYWGTPERGVVYLLYRMLTNDRAESVGLGWRGRGARIFDCYSSSQLQDASLKMFLIIKSKVFAILYDSLLYFISRAKPGGSASVYRKWWLTRKY